MLYASFLLIFMTSFYDLAGKSNLMDAISFVLGEKTSNLRVKRMSVSNTIIYNKWLYLLHFITSMKVSLTHVLYKAP